MQNSKREKYTVKKSNLPATITSFFKNKQPSFKPLLLIIFLVGSGYFLISEYLVVLVNNEPITRLALISELEKKYGESTLESLINEKLILQEAKKQNVAITDDKINQEIKKLEEDFAGQNQDLDQLLSLQKMTRDDLKEQIKIQKIVEKIVSQEIQISDAEVNEYIKNNELTVPEDAEKAKEFKDEITQQLEQQKISEKAQEWLTTLYNKAKIRYFIKF